MKLNIFAAAAIAASLAMPVLAQDKAATDTPKADTPKAQAKGKPHSHLKEKTGIEPSNQPVGAPKPVDKSKHSHPKEK